MYSTVPFSLAAMFWKLSATFSSPWAGTGKALSWGRLLPRYSSRPGSCVRRTRSVYTSRALAASMISPLTSLPSGEVVEAGPLGEWEYVGGFEGPVGVVAEGLLDAGDSHLFLDGNGHLVV